MILRSKVRLVLSAVTILALMITALPATAIFAAEGPIFLTSDYVLGADKTFAGTGFIIGADNITLDLNGHTITGSGAANPGMGVDVFNHTGITIKNGTISGFGLGVNLYYSNSNNIQNIYSGNNNIGIFVNNSSQNVLVANSIAGSRNSGIIVMNNSDNNQVINCTSQNNAVSGIWLNDGSDGNLIDGCILTENIWNGIFFGGGGEAPNNDPSNNNTVKNCSISGSPTGINEFNSSSNTVQSSIFANNNIGIFVNNSSLNVLAGNVVRESGNSGIILVNNSDSNQVINCASRNNAVDGIWVNNGSDGNLIAGCNLKGNTINGVFIGGGGPAPNNVPSNNNIVQNSVIMDNGSSGLVLVNSTGTSIARNTIDKNGESFVPGTPPPPPPPAGIELIGSNHNSIVENNVDNNFFTGIGLAGSSNNTISNNHVNANGGTGVGLGASSNNEILNNTINSNAGSGLLFAPLSKFNNIEDNKMLNNAIWDILDSSTGSGTIGTGNFYQTNKGKISSPDGLVN